MIRLHIFILMLGSSLGGFAMAAPADDLDAFRAFYEARFTGVELDAHRDGAYALDAQKRAQWLAMEDFPPYEFAVDDGEILFNNPFANGQGYGDCFENNGAAKQHYPYFDENEGGVVTLEIAINKCREENGEPPFEYGVKDIALLASYVAYVSRGRTINVDIAAEGLKAYENGKQYYYSRRGQLNFSCSHCHMQMAGMKLRAETLSASLGHVTHWPTYRFKWEEVGNLHRRFVECNEQVGAEALPLQSATYRNLEYFLTYMSNGLTLNGPASRK